MHADQVSLKASAALSRGGFAGRGVGAGASPERCRNLRDADPDERSGGRAGEEGGIGEIVVTANRRLENLQRVPISVTAFKGEALVSQGVKSVVDLPQLTPGLGFTRTLVGTNAFLRGVGTTSAGYSIEARIATYIDGLYLPNSAASSFSVNNVERIEVLKGPQGTLYGRSARAA